MVTFTFFKIVKAFTVEGTEIYLDGENLGNPAGAFWFYAIVALAAIIWGYFYVPETKGVTLEKRRKAPSFEIKNNGKYPKNRLVLFIMVRYHNSWLICWKGSITRSSNLASRKDIS